jgi:hypothetical protein
MIVGGKPLEATSFPLGIKTKNAIKIQYCYTVLFDTLIFLRLLGLTTSHHFGMILMTSQGLLLYATYFVILAARTFPFIIWTSGFNPVAE